MKAAIFSAADSINAQFDTMPKTWNQAWTSMQNTALMAFRPILKRINEIANSEGFQVFVNGAINALSLLASTALTVFDIMTTIAKAIADNWSILAPIILGVTSALLAYAAATRIAAAAQAIYNAILNANPLVRIIMLITIAITLVMAAANAVAKMTKVANTGFGVITGGLNVVKEGFLNLVLAVANVTLGIYNAISALVADIVIAFLNCVTDVEIFFINLQKTVNDVILAIAEALNNLPFIDFDVTGLKQSSINYANEIALKEANKGKFLDIGEEFDKGLNTYDAFADGWMVDAFTAGAEWGDNVWADFENTLAGIGDNPLADIENQYDFGEITNGIADTLDGIAGNIADTAEDTAAMRDVLETSETELKYLREIAEREAINRFTTATINVDMTNNNTINSEQDIDGIIEILQIEVENAMLAVSEGSHV